MDITDLQHGRLVHGHQVDTTAAREHQRQRRLTRLVVVFGLPLAWVWYRELTGNPVSPGLPSIVRSSPELSLLVVLLVLMAAMTLIPYLGAGKSPHTMLRASD